MLASVSSPHSLIRPALSLGTLGAAPTDYMMSVGTLGGHRSLVESVWFIVEGFPTSCLSLLCDFELLNDKGCDKILCRNHAALDCVLTKNRINEPCPDC